MKKNLTFKLVQKWKRKLNEENSCENNLEKVVKASKEKTWLANGNNNSEKENLMRKPTMKTILRRLEKKKKKLDLQIGLTKVRK